MFWQKTKISEFLTERTDRFKPDEANELGLPRIEKIDFSGTIYINNFKPTKTGMILVKPGDLVISGINVEKGALAIYKGETDALATIHYSSYTYDENIIDIEYLKWYLQSNIFLHILKEQVKGGIKTEVKPRTFLNLEIMLPNIEIQKQIAFKLNKLEWNVKDLDFTCFCNKELIDKLRQSILQNAIQGKLVPQNPNDEPASELLKRIKAEKEDLIKQGKIKKERPLPPITKDEIPFEIPKGWEWVKLNDVLIKLTDGTHRTPNYQTKGIPFLSVKNISSGFIDLSNTKYISKTEHEELFKRCNPQKGDILLTKVGTTGIPAIVNTDTEFSLFVSVALLKFNNNVLDKNYLYYLLLSPLVQSQAKENTKGIGNKNWVIDKIAQTIILLPPFHEQKRIVEKVDELMQLCDKLEDENNNAQKSSSELLQSIMQKYFTAEV